MSQFADGLSVTYALLGICQLSPVNTQHLSCFVYVRTSTQCAMYFRISRLQSVAYVVYSSLFPVAGC
jgi:hypothetical protein